MIAIPFLFNSIFNFAVGILVARVLGPAEYGRYALALSVAVVLQTLGLDWLRLSATRFYSAQDQIDHPEIRATLDLIFITVVGVAALIVCGIVFSGIELPLSTGLVALAVAAAVFNAVFDISAALLRARFLDRAYGLFVICKNVLAAVLTVGGAWYFASAKVALAGLILSVAGSFVISRKMLIDRHAPPRLADRRLVLKFAAYAMPIVFANVLYQAVPMLNRGAVSQVYGFAEAGQLALAFEIGIRIIGSIGSGLDVFLFQVAVRVEKTLGLEAARAQVSRNMGVVFAIVVPAIAGCWLILPSFESLFVPMNFRGSFAHYFTLMLPALLCFALTNYCAAPAFQISHRTVPLIICGVVAFVANALAVALIPVSVDASKFAIAQSISSCAGFLTIIVFLCRREPILPRLWDVCGTLLGVAMMLLAVAPMRAMQAGPTTLVLEACAGLLVYGCFGVVFDVCGFRTTLLSQIKAALARRRSSAREAAESVRASDGFSL